MRDTSQIKLLSAIELRQRWRLGWAIEYPTLIPRLERLMADDLRVADVHGDGSTGRILVRLKSAFPPEEMRVWIEACLAKIESTSEESLAAQAEHAARRSNVFSILGEIPGRSPLLFAKPICLSLFFNVLNLLPPLIYAAIAFLGMNGSLEILTGMGVHSVTLQFVILAIGAILIYGMRTVLSFTTRDAWRELGETIEHSIRLRVFERVQHIPLRKLNSRSYSSVRDVVSDDTIAVGLFYEKGFEDVLRKVATFVFVELVYLFLAPVASLLVLLIVFGFWISWTVFHRNAISPYKSSVQSITDMNDHISKNLAGVETVRSYVAEEFEVERMRKKSEVSRLATARAAIFTWTYSHFVEFSLFVSFLMILTISGIMLAHGMIEVGSFIVLVFMIPRIGVVFEGLEQILEVHQKANAASRRIMGLLQADDYREQGGKESVVSSDVRGEIEFRDITFAYPDRAPVFSDVNLKIPAGSSCALVGNTGAGKSTLAKLLLKFYDLEHGQITLDGRDIKKLGAKDLRSVIGYVSQDTYLFNGPLIDNIRFGRPTATEEEVVAAVKMVGIYDFIQSLEKGFDTIVGERGQFLSGGQRQLISIARALIKNPRIFIFDEATSSLDNESEALIRRAIGNVMRERTTIVIAHRLSTIVNVDRIHVLSGGTIRESGSHEELSKSDGLYSVLWQLQTKVSE